jgi:hypothetical protein
MDPDTALIGDVDVTPVPPETSVIFVVVGLLFGIVVTCSDLILDDFINYSVNIDPDKMD